MLKACFHAFPVHTQDGFILASKVLPISLAEEIPYLRRKIIRTGIFLNEVYIDPSIIIYKGSYQASISHYLSYLLLVYSWYLVYFVAKPVTIRTWQLT